MRQFSKAVFVVFLLAVFVGVTFVAVDGAAGRWKKGPNNACVWDAKDTGPDQCTPKKGRYKQDGNKCVWDANDSGPDQCSPKKGRYKKDGDKCVWDANDSGRDQCKPR